MTQRIRLSINDLEKLRERVPMRRSPRRSAVKLALGGLIVWLLLSQNDDPLTVVKVASAAHGDTVDYTFWVTSSTPIALDQLEDRQCDRPPVYEQGDVDGDRQVDRGETWRFTCTFTVPPHQPGEDNPVAVPALVTGRGPASAVSVESGRPPLEIVHPPPEEKECVEVETLDFESLGHGCHSCGLEAPFEVLSSGGEPPVLIWADRRRVRSGPTRSVNAAVVFDSGCGAVDASDSCGECAEEAPGDRWVDCLSGVDLEKEVDRDLCTPNAAYRGAGRGDGGARAPFENDRPLGSLLVIAANLCDRDRDDRVDRVDDAYFGGELRFDFSSFGSVTLRAMTLVDVEEGPVELTVRYSSGSVGRVDLLSDGVGDNGAAVLGFSGGVGGGLDPRAEILEEHDDWRELNGVSGVEQLVLELQGSGGVDDIVFTRESGGRACD